MVRASRCWPSTRGGRLSRGLLATLFVGLITQAFASSASAGVQALFDLSAAGGVPFGPTYHLGAPFPTDHFTVPDSSQNTGERVNLPYPATDCTTSTPPTDPACFGPYTLNFLDGFNVQPRLSIPFSGPIDPKSVNNKDVFLVGLGSVRNAQSGPNAGRSVGENDRNENQKSGQIIGINQVVWDVANNILHAESDALLDQYSRYALMVTNGIKDANGNPIEMTDAFRNFRHDLLSSKDPALKRYGQELADTLDRALSVSGIPAKSLIDASVFTTQSVTSNLEKIRAQIKQSTVAPANFVVGPGGTRAVYKFSDFDAAKGGDVIFNLQFGLNPNDPASFQANDTGAEFLPDFYQVGQMAFGTYFSPNYLTSNAVIPPVGSLTGNPAPQGAPNQIYFTLILPAGTKPKNGWPVAIFGHGAGEGKDFAAIDVAGELANNGVATIIINEFGFGWGPASTVEIHKVDGTVVTVPAPGRGKDLDGDGFITAGDGAGAVGPLDVGPRDSNQQTAADWMQLVREIQVGMDVDGDGKPDLDPSRIYHVGLSQGSIVGTLFDAVEPAVGSAVINVGGGPLIDIIRLRPNEDIPSSDPNYPSTFEFILQNKPVPSLLNGPNGTYIDNTPFRNQPVVINKVPGADAIQAFDDAATWNLTSGDAVPYAQHLRKKPLSGVPAKSVIVSFGKGDKIVPNPTETALVRAGELADRVTYFRNDLVSPLDPTLAAGGAFGLYPHIFMIDFEDNLAFEISMDAGEQVGRFFASDGTRIDNPEAFDPSLPPGLFEVPIGGPLPETLNYIF